MLGVGNIVVVKLSNLMLFIMYCFIELLIEVGVLVGVFNFVIGVGEVGVELLCNLDVDFVLFMGGVVVGVVVMNVVVGNFKKIVLELGGKNLNIIFDDVDFDIVVDYVVNVVFFYVG